MNDIRTIFLIGSLSVTLYLSYQLYNTESQKRLLKEDLIEISKAKYGMFNVDEWKRILADLITKKVEEFNLNDANKEGMREKVSNFLYQAIDEFEVNFKEDNREKSWFGISSKNMIAGAVGLFPKLRDNIPQFTDQILTYLDDPENRENIRAYLVMKLNEYAGSTFSELDYVQYDEILTKYNYVDKAACMAGIELRMQELDSKNQFSKYLLSLLILGQIMFLIFFKNISKSEFLLLIILSSAILLVGLLLPMIDIDARISKMSFNLLGEPIEFQDQVLYYKSKSILEVVQLMLFQGKFELIIVGLLVLLFSVLFPLTKLISSVIVVFNPGLKESSFLRFMVYKTGKWSMADVMVIAIFMSYIGFSGILTEQLNQLETIAPNLDMLTTNQSTLQSGFYFFTTFVILSLLISDKIQKTEMDGGFGSTSPT